MHRIPRADDKIELEREILRQLSLVTHNHDVVCTQLHDVVELVIRRYGGEDLGAESVGEDDCMVTLQTSKVSIFVLEHSSTRRRKEWQRKRVMEENSDTGKE
jgi:hypothetical protein